MKRYTVKSLLAAASLATGLGVAHSAVISVDAALQTFTGEINFTGIGQGTAATTFGPVTFGSFFSGQRLGTNLGDCGSGALLSVNNCVIGTPTTGLTPSGVGNATVVADPDNPSGGNPVLAGSSNIANGDPIAIRFGSAVNALSFTAGGFNAISSTRVQLFTADGLLIDIFTPAGTRIGTEVLNTAGDADGEFVTFSFVGASTDLIAGVLISVVGIEENGFAIDNLRYLVAPTTSGTPPSGTPPSGTRPGGTPVPAPASLALVGLALVALGFMRRRRA